MMRRKKDLVNTDKKSDTLKDLQAAIKQYADFKLDGMPRKHEFLDMHEETVVNRAAIHDMLNELGGGAAQQALEVRSIDKKWQQWVEEQKEEGFKLIGLNRDKEPKSEWWFWIDELENLSEEEKDTL